MQASDPTLIIPPNHGDTIPPALAALGAEGVYYAEGATWAPLGAARGPAGPALGTNASIVSARRAGNNAGRSVALRYSLQETSARLLPAWRVAVCMRSRLDGGVNVIHHPQHSSASYGGLVTCGSVWVCPVCSAKIAARRQAEIAEGAARWRARGGGFLLVTMTLRHNKSDMLSSLMGAINGAHRWARGGRGWQFLSKEFGIRGAITSREITVGYRGWHPHLHALWFLDKPLPKDELAQLQDIMKERWITALGKMGADASYDNGFDIQDVPVDTDKSLNEIIPYIVKQSQNWSMTEELTLGQHKKARGGNMTIAELLKKAATGNNRAEGLFREYATATKGHNMVVWTPGLRALVGQAEKAPTDGELAAAAEEGGQVVLTLTPQQWQMICYDKGRGRLLAALAKGGRPGLEHWLDVHRYPIEPWQWAPQGEEKHE